MNFLSVCLSLLQIFSESFSVLIKKLTGFGLSESNMAAWWQQHTDCCGWSAHVLGMLSTWQGRIQEWWVWMLWRRGVWVGPVQAGCWQFLQLGGAHAPPGCGEEDTTDSKITHTGEGGERERERERWTQWGYGEKQKDKHNREEKQWMNK